MALDLTIAGSQTQASKLSAMSSLRTSTPYQVPSPACFCQLIQDVGGIEPSVVTQL